MAQDQVADGTADDVGLVTGVLQGFDDAARAVIDQAGVDAMLALRDVHPLADRDAGRLGSAAARCGAALFGRVFAQNLVYEALDHANSLRMRQPRSRATSSSAGLGLVATGSLARSSRGRSLGESL